MPSHFACCASKILPDVNAIQMYANAPQVIYKLTVHVIAHTTQVLQLLRSNLLPLKCHLRH